MDKEELRKKLILESKKSTKHSKSNNSLKYLRGELEIDVDAPRRTCGFQLTVKKKKEVKKSGKA